MSGFDKEVWYRNFTGCLSWWLWYIISSQKFTSQSGSLHILQGSRPWDSYWSAQPHRWRSLIFWAGQDPCSQIHSSWHCCTPCMGKQTSASPLAWGTALPEQVLGSCFLGSSTFLLSICHLRGLKASSWGHIWQKIIEIPLTLARVPNLPLPHLSPYSKPELFSTQC